MSQSTLERTGSSAGSNTDPWGSWDSSPDDSWGSVPTSTSNTDPWGSTTSGWDFSPTSTVEVASKPKLSDKLRGFRDSVREKLSGARNSEAWRDAEPEVRATFQTAGRAALDGIGVTRNGRFSVLGTARVAAEVATGVGAINVAKRGARGIASHPELQDRAAALGNGLLDRAAETSDGAAAAVGFARSAAENPLVRMAAKRGARHLVGKIGRGRAPRHDATPQPPSLYTPNRPNDGW